MSQNKLISILERRVNESVEILSVQPALYGDLRVIFRYLGCVSEAEVSPRGQILSLSEEDAMTLD